MLFTLCRFKEIISNKNLHLLYLANLDGILRILGCRLQSASYKILLAFLESLKNKRKEIGRFLWFTLISTVIDTLSIAAILSMLAIIGEKKIVPYLLTSLQMSLKDFCCPFHVNSCFLSCPLLMLFASRFTSPMINTEEVC